MKINHKSSIVVLSALLMTGCASVNMASKEESDKAKQFSARPPGNPAFMSIAIASPGRL